MSMHSARSSINSRRTNSLQQNGRIRREMSYSRKKQISEQDAYSFALRAAFLSHLLQPRARRREHVAAPAKPSLQRSTTSINDLVKDLALIRDSKSTRFPHGFTSELDKRITSVLVGKERMPEFNDAVVKRTFAVFLNEFKNPTFRKSMEKDRRVEDLILIFFSKATSELSKGKTPDDDGWKLMVDRHVALFVRLITSTLKDNDWNRDRPELTARLKTLESKLLVHSQDLADDSARNGGAGGHTIEVEVPVSYAIKDMPGVLKVANVFGKMNYDEIQADIDTHKDIWTPKAALQDLKLYQTHLSLNDKMTLSSDDFDLMESYEQWKKLEVQDLSQMMLAIIQSYPELAKSTATGGQPILKSSAPTNIDTGSPESHTANSIDQQLDVRNLAISDDLSGLDQNSSFMFIPSEPRAYYLAVLRRALSNDIASDDSQPADANESGGSPVKILSKQSSEILSEIALRWRIPPWSRLVLFLEAMKDKFQNHEISLETLDNAFVFVKEPVAEGKLQGKKLPQAVQESLGDRSRWTLTDFAMYQQILASLHEALLRELFDLMQHCYESKPPSIGPVMYILEHHIYDDTLFGQEPEDLDQFSESLNQALHQRARDAYGDMLAKNVPEQAAEWEFYHIIQLGKAVITLADRIQKRYRKNPEVMGVNPLNILVQEIFPSFAADARDLVSRIMDVWKSRGEEVPIQDGFDLYKELVEIRRVHAQALPDIEFGFHIEGLLSDFVWRWIAMTDEKMVGWIEEAFRQDKFQTRQEHADNIPNDDERHSSSALDMFKSFGQSIEQIVGLEWDDDLQYAKFMTAISKTVGTATARYCELVEQRFIIEMDRVTPEQQAAARLTRQEKWMQMARDTVVGKEKAEPFQFSPESLVKLNNIEYATTQLDKLENEVNVDACAEIIQKHAPPVPKVRQTNKFVFTIKIIEAEDLKPCDMNGLSDPYVVLGDEYQKRLAKTRIIYGSLNPRFDESVDIITQGPLNIIATIWDWDALGDHDCCGRTSLKLDPSHFNDYMPREFWLDLDTQGRLLLRVSMEGERDDIQFYFGKAFRTLKRTERDMTRKITDKLSAFIQQSLSHRTLRSLTSQPITMTSVRNLAGGYFSKVQGRPQSVAQPPPKLDVASAIKPLLNYFDENFAIMKQTLTDASMITVMTRLWKEVLVTLEGLLVPPLSDKPSQQKQLSQQEVDVVYKWLQLLFDFFHAEGDGVPLDILRSPKYHDLQHLAYFYSETTDNLIRTSESMATATTARQQSRRDKELDRMSQPGSLVPSYSFSGASLGLPTARRSKSIMLSRNLGTMKKAKEEKRKEAQAEPSDDLILRILRMRPEAERYLKDRSRQKERLAAHAAAEMIVRQSILAQRTGR